MTSRRRRRTLFDDVRMFGRFARGLNGFLRRPLSLGSCRDVVEQSLAVRETSFLDMVLRAIYENPGSPYLRLLEWSGIEFGDIAGLVRSDGVDAALEWLFDAGVHISIDEFKGRRSIRRGSQEILVSAADFDNPVLPGHFEGMTGGSRGGGRRLVVDLGVLTYDTAAHGLFLEAFGVTRMPLALWRPVAPGAAGTKKALMHARLRLPIERWYSQNRPSILRNPRAALFTSYLVWASRRSGAAIPSPEHCPIQGASAIARWLSSRVDGGIHFDTNVSSAVRICLAARDHRRSLENVFFRLGGEPLTAARAALFGELGAKVTCHYSMSEFGHIGMACADPHASDDVHLRNDRIAMIIRPAAPPHESVGAFHFTSLAADTPKVMLNVANGDYGTVERRRCGCLFGKLGLDVHLQEIRSYEKLTTAGMQFLGADLIQLLDEVLPVAFGGGPTDYQLVEREAPDARTFIQLVISPRVGTLDEERCLETVFGFLESRAPENRMMVERLRQENALQIVRREPHHTHASKILSLHLTERHGP